MEYVVLATARYYYLHKFGIQNVPVENELQQELDWACSRPSSQAERSVRWDESSDPESQDVWVKALNLGEERFRSSYLITSPEEVFQLNQNPDSGFGATSRKGLLPTIIGNAHMLWTQQTNPPRWLMGSEALATLGFPVIPFLWGIQADMFPPLCSFNKARSGRTSRTMFTQAGNSMSVFVMAVILVITDIHNGRGRKHLA